MIYLFIQYTVLVALFFILDCVLDVIKYGGFSPGYNLFMALILVFACEAIAHGLVFPGIALGLFIILFGKMIYLLFFCAKSVSIQKQKRSIR